MTSLFSGRVFTSHLSGSDFGGQGLDSISVRGNQCYNIIEAQGQPLIEKGENVILVMAIIPKKAGE